MPDLTALTRHSPEARTSSLLNSTSGMDQDGRALGQEERGHAEWSVHCREQAGSDSCPRLLTLSTVDGQGTSLKKSYPVLCQVSLQHRNGRDFFFFKGQSCLVINLRSHLFEVKF